MQILSPAALSAWVLSLRVVPFSVAARLLVRYDMVQLDPRAVEAIWAGFDDA